MLLEFQADREFSIRHHASDIKYNANYFVQKNAEDMPNELKSLGLNSLMPFCMTVLKCSSDDGIDPNSNTTATNSIKNNNSSNHGSSVRAESILHQFRSSFHHLAHDLEVS